MKYAKNKQRSLRSKILNGLTAFALSTMAITSMTGSALADTLLEKIKSGEPIRLGFTNEPPSAYPGPNGEPLGLGNVITIAVLEKMGATNVEAVVTDWGSLIPGLTAGRFDVITAAMWIKPERCRNVLFSEPIGVNKDGLIVEAGNPLALHSYEDIRDKGLTVVTGAGYTSVQDAQRAGIPDDKIMQVAGPAEMIQAVKSGRAAAAAFAHVVAKTFANKDPSIELAEPFVSNAPSNYPAIAFQQGEQDAVDAFNAVLKDYIGTDEMLAAVAEYGYGKEMLPDGTTTAEACAQ